VGAGTQATASSATAVGGNGAAASGNSSTTVGSGSSVAADFGVGLGAQAVVEAGAEGGAAVGPGAHVSGKQGIALGQNANTSGDNSAAIGANSVAAEDNTVSFGNDTMNRRLTHVGEGINPTDAVNLAQMQAGDARTLMQANAYTDQVFSRVEKKINAAGAAASAMGIMAGTAAGNAQAGRNRIAMGVANYNGQSAIAMGYQRTIRDRISLTLGASFSGSERVVGAGVSFGW
jgi:autotransporter adhesin